MNEKKTRRSDELVARAARKHYNPPGDAPREEIWARVQEARRSAGVDREEGAGDGRSGAPVWARWTIGIAAALLVGVGLGRMSVMQETGVTPGTPAGDRIADTRPAGEPTSVPAGTGVPESAVPAAFRLAAIDALERADVVLTSFRSEAGSGRITEQTTEWARDLLGTTRLLLDSPASRDPRMRSLLRDLELVLAQIASLRTDDVPDVPEVELVTEAVDRRDVLTRVRLMSGERLALGPDR